MRKPVRSFVQSFEIVRTKGILRHAESKMTVKRSVSKRRATSWFCPVSVKTWFLLILMFATASPIYILCHKVVQLKATNNLVRRTKTVMATVVKDFENPRKVQRKLLSEEQDEGVGARVRRSIGRLQMKTLDPFLLLDEFRVKPPAGFPDHPHRGFETVTYMLKGAFTHEDFDGHKGTILPGDLQWMTAGRGIVHSEMPATEEESHGLQLWVNLAAKDKMVPSNYQELLAKDVPKVEKDGVKVAVIAGSSLGTTSPVYTRTPTMYLDFTLQPGSEVHQPVPQGWNGFVYTLSGNATFGSESEAPSEPHYTLELGPGDGLSIWNKAETEARFVLIAGKPLGEPVHQYGPFVMNSREQIMETIKDYQLGRNGFEKARFWQSSS